MLFFVMLAMMVASIILNLYQGKYIETLTRNYINLQKDYEVEVMSASHDTVVFKNEEDTVCHE